MGFITSHLYLVFGHLNILSFEGFRHTLKKYVNMYEQIE
jgi:hypothetical protein